MQTKIWLVKIERNNSNGTRLIQQAQVFGLIVKIPNGVKPIGYKKVFGRKCNKRNEIQHYKARLVVQSFSQRLGIDYDETYSLVMNSITFLLITMVAKERL